MNGRRNAFVFLCLFVPWIFGALACLYLWAVGCPMGDDPRTIRQLNRAVRVTISNTTSAPMNGSARVVQSGSWPQLALRLPHLST